MDEILPNQAAIAVKQTALNVQQTAINVQQRPTNIQQTALNVQQTPSLDPHEKIVWKSENIENFTHFKEDVHYLMEKDSFDKGGHGALHNVVIHDRVRQSAFGSLCGDFVVKKVLLMKYSMMDT